MAFLSVNALNGPVKSGGFQLRDINFQVQRFQKIAIAGGSGSGKTSLLKTIAGFEQHVAGTMLLNDQLLRGPDWQLVPGHAGIAYLSQHFELRNNYRLEEILEMHNKLPRAEADELFDLCGISHLLKRKNIEVSGGERQRVALARALTTRPQLLLLDEPFSNLDLPNKQKLKAIVDEACSRYQITCLLASHDPADCLPWADEIIVMDAGKIVQRGTPQEIFYQPKSVAIAGLFGTFNLLPADNPWYNAKEPLINNRVFCRPNELAFSNDKTKCSGIVRTCALTGQGYVCEAATEFGVLQILSHTKMVLGGMVFIEGTGREE